MAALAIAGEQRFMLDDSEVRSAEPSYTINTLQRLRDKHGRTPLVLLLGVDAYLGLASWHRWREIFDLGHIAIATRPGYVLDTQTMGADLRDATLRCQSEDVAQLAATPAGSVITFAMPPLDISASAIRAKLADGEATEHLLPRPVLDYIAAKHLYSYYAHH